MNINQEKREKNRSLDSASATSNRKINMVKRQPGNQIAQIPLQREFLISRKTRPFAVKDAIQTSVVIVLELLVSIGDNAAQHARHRYVSHNDWGEWTVMYA